MRSPEQVRPFTVLDAMILTAATAAGLASYSSAGFRPENFLQYANDTETYVYLFVNYLVRSAHPFLRAWGVAWIVIRLRKPRPRWRRLTRQPGVSAMLAACLGWAFGLVSLFLGCLRWFHETPGIPTLNFHNVESILLGGFGVIVAWSVSVLVGCWRPEPTWIDRLGRALGVGWIASFLLFLAFFYPPEFS